MEWVGLLMGQPNKVWKPVKHKTGEKWSITDRMGNDVYMRLKKSGGHQFVDSAGTIVAEKDIWFVHGFTLQDTLDFLITRKTIWDTIAQVDNEHKQEVYNT